MPFYIDLRFSGAALLLVLLFGPVVAFVVRRRWRLVTARQEEVRRLAYLAAQEAALAEMEVMAAYSVTSSVGAYSSYSASVARELAAPPECAVCSIPANARCARCKAVRYCSGRCQIIHWRQGHKDECQPPPDNDKYNSENKLSSSGLKGVHSEQSGLSEKRLDPKEDLTKIETIYERPSASKVTSTDNEIDGGKHQDSSSKDISAKIFFSDSSSSPTLPTHSTLSETVGSPDASYASMLIPNNAGLEEPPSGGLIFSIDTDNVRTKMQSTPELAASNPLSSTTCHVSKELFTFKAEADERIPNSTSGFKPTNDQVNTEWSGRVDNRFNSSTLPARDYPPAAVSLEARTHAERNETEISKQESSESLVSAHYSTNGGAKSVSFYESSNANAHRASFESKNIPYVANGLSTSVKQVVTKVSRHYSSEFMLFPYDLFIKLYNSDKIDLRPCGLTNCGNSCYANAVLQCLTFTRPLTAYLLEGLHSKACPKEEWCFTCELESLARTAKEGKSPLSPIGILSHLHNIGSNFGHRQQEDAHEFLRYAIEAMQSVCLKQAVAKPDGLLEETTLIQQTFGGYLRSKIRCSKCKNKSEQCERMMDLTVEIDGNIATLDDALLRFTSQEILEGENKYKCDRCKSYERAKKRLTILEAPNVLTIVLKRFQVVNHSIFL
ncbi:ubiquitin carboxyl-terminal hydrolase 16-like [Curcuma longa]|uniref:ubiquitin carboxyl-terminal hydrolase 16-like n=1 Tax=Curcuma longa TaxID=136217 RepID=UPI003D9E5406